MYIYIYTYTHTYRLILQCNRPQALFPKKHPAAVKFHPNLRCKQVASSSGACSVVLAGGPQVVVNDGLNLADYTII